MFDPSLEFVFRRHLCKDINTAKTRTAYVPAVLTEKGIFASSEGCRLQLHIFFSSATPQPD